MAPNVRIFSKLNQFESAAASFRPVANSTTLSGLPLPNFSSGEDLSGFDSNTDLGEPGQFPFTRGIYPTMYRGRLWTMRQYAGFGTAAQSNERFRYLLSRGQTG